MFIWMFTWTLLFEVRLVTAIEVTGHVGGSVTVKCPYWIVGSKMSYFCQFPCMADEHILIKSGQSTEGKYRLEESTGDVSVTITGLQKLDTGTYWCGEDKYVMNETTKVSLIVEDASLKTVRSPEPSTSTSTVSPSTSTTPFTTHQPLTISLTTTYWNITVTEECQVNFTVKCGVSIIDQIQNVSNLELSQENVTRYLGLVLNTQEQLLVSKVNISDKLVSYGNSVLNSTEKLVSAFVKPTDTNYSINISLTGLDIQVIAIGPRTALKEIPPFKVNEAQMDINLFEFSQNNNGSAAVAFMSYTNMSDMLKPSLFSTSSNTVKTMMSTVVSVVLIKTSNIHLTQPVNFTFKHTQESVPNGILSCVYWKETEWVVDGCSMTYTNSSHTVCSCVHLSTFALIMQTSSDKENPTDSAMELLTTVAVAVGLVFLGLTLLIFALFGRNPRVTSTARTHLCICLFLAHFFYILTQKLLKYIKNYQWMCATTAAVLHFLFLSAFVWMFIDAVMLFISVKNLARLKCNHKDVLSWKGLLVVGYTVPLLVVGVSAGVVPSGYGSEECWLKEERHFNWSFLGPVSFILASNTILFIGIFIYVASTLQKMKSDALKMKQTKSNQVFVKSVILKTVIQFFILGCPWVLGFFTKSSKVVEVLFLLLNSQQGTFIFLIHCVFNKEVRQELGKQL